MFHSPQVILFSDDLERAVRFYEGLGLDDHGLDPVTQGQRTAVVLWTNDISAAYARVTGQGAQPLAAPHEGLGRLLIAWVADPDGNPVQIVQEL